MYSVSAAVRSIYNEDGGILLDIVHGQMFRLNPIGVLILKLIAAGLEEAEIAKEVAGRCNVKQETVEADVSEFLTLLLQRNLLVNALQGEKIR